MSFTTEVKNEISKTESSELEKIAELTTIVSLSEVNESIKILTENYSIARRIFQLFKDVVKLNPIITVRNGLTYQNKNLFILSTKEKAKVFKILLLNDNIPSEDIVNTEDGKRAFLKSIFMMTASISDPKKSRYHLEFLLNSRVYAMFLNDILNSYFLNSKVLKRENKYMVYIKESEKISDFLRIIKAYNAVLYYEDIRIYRDHKNMTNRLNNCEQANVDRIIATSNEQINQIEFIKEKVGLDLLDEKEQIVCEYRLKYPEVSLLELSEIISLETGFKITKSGLYHRFKKIKDFYLKLTK